eukprot:6180140-Pleurochrysis_carterae.AAC.2
MMPVAAKIRCVLLLHYQAQYLSACRLFVSHSLVPATLSFAYGARSFLREWGERSGYASNAVELATHRICGVRVRARREP